MDGWRRIIKKKRVHEIISLSNEYENNFYQSKIDKVYDGVVEVHNNGETIVHTSNFIPVIIKDEILNNNEIVNVKITDVKTWSMDGEIIE